MARTDDRGVALIIVVWVLALLTVMAGSLAFATKTASLSSFHFKEETKAEFISEAGVDYGVMKLLQSKQLTEVEDLWRADGTVHAVPMEGGAFHVSLVDESGKVDINKSSPVILKGLLEVLNVSPEDADIMVDSIVDWRDEDDARGLNGAEDEYYMSLPVPYSTKDKDFDTVEELLLVRGITPQLLYGNGSARGLVDFLTVYSSDGKINLGSAPYEVLMAVPGMTEDTATSIVGMRELDDTGSSYDIQALTGGAYALMQQYVKMTAGNAYSVDSVGYSDDGGVGYRIRAVVGTTGQGQYEVLNWSDRLPLPVEPSGEEGE